MINIIKRRKIWFTLSSILIVSSVVAIFSWGLKFGIDFTGGSLLEVGFKEGELTHDEIKDSLSQFELGDIMVQNSSDETVFIRIKDVDEDTHQNILAALDIKLKEKLGVNSEEAEIETETLEGATEESVDTQDDAVDVEISSVETTTEEPSVMTVLDENGEEVEVTIESADSDSGIEIAGIDAGETYVLEKRFDSIGPVIGEELKTSTIWAVIIALLAIAFYIAFAFRKVSYPISSYKYGIAAIIALFHDVIITVGAFAILGHFYGVEVGVSFAAALLAILGYSINDTIVVFDRTRENLIKAHMDDFEEAVNVSVNETLVRSLNTSFTTLLTLFALYLFGGASISYFVLALIIGIACGTYSSIFVASPILVAWQRFEASKK